jgi:ABC-2 type transport system permease protein
MDVNYKRGKYIKFSIYLIVLVLLNLTGVTLFLRQDLTKNHKYSLSKASKKAVSTLSEPLTIKAFFTSNLPAPYNNNERYLKDLLEEYAINSNAYFNYQFYDVSPEENNIGNDADNNQQMAQNYGIYPVQIQSIEKDEVKFKNAYMGIVIIHGDLIEKIPTITSTDKLEYELTTSIKKLNNKVSALLNLSGKIKVRLFLSSSLEKVAGLMKLPNLSQLPEDLKIIVDKLSKKNYDKLEFSYVDPHKDSRWKESVEKHGIMNLEWPAINEGNIQPGQGAIGIIMEYKDKTVQIPLLQVFQNPFFGTYYELMDMKNMEELINKNIEAIININEDIGYLTSHGALNLYGAPESNPMSQQQPEETLFSFKSLVSKNYTFQNIDLSKDRIPESIQCLVIARPTAKFTDYELFQIDQHVMKGNNLAVFYDPFKEVLPSDQGGLNMQNNQRGPAYFPLDTGLEALLEHYGVTVNKSYVMDKSCYKQQKPAQLGGGEQEIFFAPLIKNKSINNDLDFMNNIKEMFALKVSPVKINQARVDETGIKAIKLFSSSEESWEMKDQINFNPMFIDPPDSQTNMQSYALAYLLEGEFASYFKDKPIPIKKIETPESLQEKKEEKKADDIPSKIQRKDDAIEKSRGSKIFIIGSTAMITDNIIDQEGKSPNAVFVLNVIDYLNNRGEIAAMRSKEESFNPLNDTSMATKYTVKALNIAGLPVVVICLGFFVWIKRRARRKKIKFMFQKEKGY